MQTRFKPSLESLGDRVCPSPWVPHTEQTRQITVIQDMSPQNDEVSFGAGGTDSVWIDLDAPVRAAPDAGNARRDYQHPDLYLNVWINSPEVGTANGGVSW